MAKDYAEAFYNSEAWHRCRRAYIAERLMIDGGLCEECGERVGYIVHHMIPLTEQNINDPEITLSFDLLEYVCKSCHDQFEGHGVVKEGLTPRLRFDGEGQPLPPPPLKSKF